MWVGEACFGGNGKSCLHACLMLRLGIPISLSCYLSLSHTLGERLGRRGVKNLISIFFSLSNWIIEKPPLPHNHSLVLFFFIFSCCLSRYARSLWFALSLQFLIFGLRQSVFTLSAEKFTSLGEMIRCDFWHKTGQFCCNNHDNENTCQQPSQVLLCGLLFSTASCNLMQEKIWIVFVVSTFKKVIFLWLNILRVI